MKTDCGWCPTTRKEFRVEAKVVDLTRPPYSVGRYSDVNEAERVCAENEEALFRDDWIELFAEVL